VAKVDIVISNSRKQKDIMLFKENIPDGGFKTSSIYTRLNTRIPQHMQMQRMSNGWKGDGCRGK